MDLLSFIRERRDALRLFYRLHPEAWRYTFGVIFILAAAARGRWMAVLAIFLGLGVMLAYDRWGKPWQEKGAAMLKHKPKLSKP
jgi:hypothetical protein